VLLLRDRYDLLAERFVDVGNNFQNDEEVIAFLRSRVVPIPFSTNILTTAVA
jgi:hypothetical protein